MGSTSRGVCEKCTNVTVQREQSLGTVVVEPSLLLGLWNTVTGGNYRGKRSLFDAASILEDELGSLKADRIQQFPT